MTYKQIEKIRDEAAKELFRLKVQQLNKFRGVREFRHLIATETIYLFSVKFDETYEDDRMRTILHDSYAEIQTEESRTALLQGIEAWRIEKGYEYDHVFGN